MLPGVQRVQMSIGIRILWILLVAVFCKTVNSNLQDVIKELSLKLSEAQVSSSTYKSPPYHLSVGKEGYCFHPWRTVG